MPSGCCLPVVLVKTLKNCHPADGGGIVVVYTSFWVAGCCLLLLDSYLDLLVLLASRSAGVGIDV